MAQIKITVPKQQTYNLPEGQFNAKLLRVNESIKQTGKGPQTWIRLVFEVDVPGMARLTPLAGRKFLKSIDEGTDLRNFLEGWLGREFFHQLSGQELVFDDLIGKQCELTLTHFQGDDYEKPLVVPAMARPVKNVKAPQPKVVAPIVN
jgi:hypothetical protein